MADEAPNWESLTPEELRGIIAERIDDEQRERRRTRGDFGEWRGDREIQ